MGYWYLGDIILLHIQGFMPMFKLLLIFHLYYQRISILVYFRGWDSISMHIIKRCIDIICLYTLRNYINGTLIFYIKQTILLSHIACILPSVFLHTKPYSSH